MRLAIEQPWLLLALLPVAAGVLTELRAAGWLGSRPIPRQRRLAIGLRTAALVLLVLALADPRVGLGGRGVDVIFLVDASDSVGHGGRAEALAWSDRALTSRRGGDRSALALFGRSPRLEHGLTAEPASGLSPAVVVDGSATDLSSAVRFAQGVLGSERRRRAVLLTDGAQTAGDLAAVLDDLVEAGVAVDVVPLVDAAPADVLVETVRAPARAVQGDTYDVIAVLRNTGAREERGTLVVTADGMEVHREDVVLPPGTTEVRMRATADQPGTVRYEARLASGGSTRPENDVGRAAVQVQGPARVLVAEGTPGDGDELVRALTAAQIPAELHALDASPLPGLDRLLDYDSVVLVDVPAERLGRTGMAALDAYVRDAGRGLVLVGGTASFGVGGYGGTPLEELSPVFAQVTDPARRPDIAQALVVDSSESMGACHCADDGAFGPGGMATEGGPVKTEIAKEGIARAVAALDAQDTVGILAYDDRSQWVLPLQQLPADADLDQALARIHPRGGTRTAPAVRQAIEGLVDVDARLRHIVLFTDGFDSNERGLVAIAEEAAEAGITLSVVGTGEGPQNNLADMAEAGGGRFYPGRDLNSIPDIIALEVAFAARPIVNEGSFLPLVTGIAPATEDLDVSPPLMGYLATTAKPTASTLLQVGEPRDPLLATWQAGLGRVTAWTSDATTRWSAQWVTWDRFAQFWSEVVKDTLPALRTEVFSLEASVDPDGVRVRMELPEAPPEGVEAIATVTDPVGVRQQVRLDRTSLTTFEALVPATGEGVYAVGGRLVQGEEELAADAVAAIASYGAEYGVVTPDLALLRHTAEMTGGRVDPDPASVFDPEGLAPGAATRAIWPLLAILGLALAVTDVGVRRLRLEREDWRRVRTWLARRRRALADGPRVAERSEASEGLLAAKARARGGEASSAPPDEPPDDAPLDTPSGTDEEKPP